jgi:hypothetical protein
VAAGECSGTSKPPTELEQVMGRGLLLKMEVLIPFIPSNPVAAGECFGTQRPPTELDRYGAWGTVRWILAPTYQQAYSRGYDVMAVMGREDECYGLYA